MIVLVLHLGKLQLCTQLIVPKVPRFTSCMRDYHA